MTPTDENLRRPAWHMHPTGIWETGGRGLSHCEVGIFLASTERHNSQEFWVFSFSGQVSLCAHAVLFAVSLTSCESDAQQRFGCFLVLPS